MRKLLICLSVSVFIFVSLPLVEAAKIKGDNGPPSGLAGEIIACRSVADTMLRLACFDETSGRFEAAFKANDFYIVDKTRARETKRQLFGLTIPNLDIFGNDGNKERTTQAEQEADKEIRSSIKQVKRTVDGWRVTTAEDAIWQQVDQTVLGVSPKPGMSIVIRKGALGSFRMSIDNMPAIRAKRVF